METHLRENTNGYKTSDKLDFLRDAALALFEEVKSLASPKRIEFEEQIDFVEEVKRFEIYLIKRALGKTDGNRLKAARALKLKPTTLYTKIKRYKISSNGRKAGNVGKNN